MKEHFLKQYALEIMKENHLFAVKLFAVGKRSLG
jgi:hypothetical protein